MIDNRLERVGEKFITLEGYPGEIIGVGTRHGKVVVCIYGTSEFKREVSISEMTSVRHPDHPTVYGVGYLGRATQFSNTKLENSTKGNPHYIKWFSMMRRCYSEAKGFIDKPAYDGATVDPVWHNYTVFEKWSKAHEITAVRVDLDKDLLNPGGKVYSPVTCVYIPQWLNVAIANTRSNNAEEWAGVNKKGDKATRIKKYNARIQVQGKRIDLGLFEFADDCGMTYQYALGRRLLYAIDELRSLEKEHNIKFDPRIYPAVEAKAMEALEYYNNGDIEISEKLKNKLDDAFGTF